MTSQACRFPISANILCIATVFAPDNNFIGAALDANRAYRHAKVEYGCSGNLSTGKPSSTEAVFKIAYRFQDHKKRLKICEPANPRWVVSHRRQRAGKFFQHMAARCQITFEK